MSSSTVTGQSKETGMAPHFRVLSGPQQNMTIALDFQRLRQSPLVLGRKRDEVDVVLNSDHNLVSRRHALVAYRPDDELLTISDAGSANGTKVNGERIAGPVPLVPGDTVSCGDVKMLFVVPSAPMPSPERLNRGDGRGLLEDAIPGIGRLEILSKLRPDLKDGFCRLTPRYRFKIGFGPGCDLQLPGEGRPRVVATLSWAQGHYQLESTETELPVIVNRMPVKGQRVLVDGDLLDIGPQQLRYLAPRLLPGEREAAPAKTATVIAGLRYAGRWPLHLGETLTLISSRHQLTLGRARESALRLNDPSISRRHAQLYYDSGSFWLADLGSSNGSQVNNQKLSQPAALKPGDRLTLGEFEFIFELPGPDGFPDLPREKWPPRLVSLDHPQTLQLSIQTQEAARPAPAGTDFAADRQYWSSSLDNFQQMAPFAPAPDWSLDLAKLETVQPGLDLPEIWQRLGVRSVVGGNQPFLLDNPDKAWLVLAGKIEIFAVEVSKGQSLNTRHHVGTFEPGEAFFGMDLARYGEGLGLLAVGMVNTELAVVPVSLLRRLSSNPGRLASLAILLEKWVERLNSDLTRDIMLTRIDLLLETGQQLELEPGQRAGNRKDHLWVNFLEGSLLLFGEEEVSAPAMLPVFDRTWFQAHSQCQFTALTTAEVAGQAAGWEGLELFYELFFRIKFTSLRLRAYDEINRLRQKAEYDIKTGNQALARLYSILETRRGVAADLEISEEEPLLAACRLVAKAQGLTLKTPPKRENQEKPDPLSDIARASRVRYREITFEHDWWRKDSGPLLGFTGKGEDIRPVALLPVSPTAYRMVDPTTGESQKVTKSVADSLLPGGFIFYRSFPEKKLRARDIIKFGLFGSRRDILAILFYGALGGLIALFVPTITGLVFDAVVPSGQGSLLWQIFGALVVVALATASFQIVRGISILRMETKLDISIQSALWDRLLNLPTPFFRQYSTGDLAVRALGIEEIRRLLSTSVTNAILNSIFSLFSFFILFTYDVGLALVVLGLTIVTLAVITGINLWQVHYDRQRINWQGRISGLVLQLLNGIAKVRVAGAEVRAFSVWAKNFTQQRRLTFKARQIGDLQLVFNAAWPVITFLVIFWAIDIFNTRTLTTGTFLAFTVAFGQFLNGMISMAATLITVFAVVPLYERARPILETLPEATEGSADPGQLSGQVEINHVKFRYSESTPYVLNDVTLKIEAGQFVAIVGPSGAGKSSLLRLMLGFDKPESGSVYYDNQDLRGLDVQAVRRQLGVVIQNGRLMPGDIFSNIVGSAPFTQAEAWEAARLAGMEEDIKAMPMGMFTVLSEGGSTLSGGQRQRLMIARAIIARPRILLFDEATSALDNRTQAVVSASLEKLRATRIVIAHRLSTIKNADRIFVLEGGHIVQSGTFQELIEVEGPFKELAVRQLS